MKSTLAFIASMKLAALRDQRDTLADGYRSILDAAERAPNPVERLRALHDGLRELRLAGDLVHPDLADITAPLNVLGFASEAEIAQYERRMLDELRRGRARSEAVYAFGALLEQAAGDRAEPPDESGLAAYLEQLTGEPGPEPAGLAPGGLLDQLFDEAGFGRVVARCEERFEHFGTYASESGVRRIGVDPETFISRLLADPERSAALRDEARRFSDPMSEAAVALRDALEISLAEPVEWRWPGRKLAMRPVATGDRVRFHPELDLVELLTLEQLGRWTSECLPDARSGHVNRRLRIDRLVELQAPEIILANERRLFERELGVLNDPRVLDERTSPVSIAARRDIALASMWQGGMVAGSHYDGGYGATASGLARMLGAELALHRIDDRPFFAVRADIADCFASIDHRAVRAMVDRIGAPEWFRALIDRYLAAPLEGGEARRGLLLGLSLTRELVDLVLCAIELHLHRAGVRTARVVDDIALWSDDPASIAAGYRALLEATAALGLEIQPAKTGAVAAGGELPDGLPEAPLRFNLLELGPAGFAVDEDAFAELVATTRAEMEGATSVMAAVRAYNKQARFLADALIVDTPTLASAAGDHQATCGAAIQRFNREVVEGGVEAWLQSQVAARCATERPLPRAWIYWPVSAGGLGLRDVLLELGSIPTGGAERPDEPFDELESPAWGAWYAGLIEPTAAKPPRESAVTRAQMDDFIARGGELRGSEQAGLGTYWKWVLAVHGPEILERFGTFRFLLRKLVPLDVLPSR